MDYKHDFKNDEFADKYIFKHKQNGYFVEIGACDGINNSQCYFFEKNLNWDGIAIEPQKRFRNKMIKNRINPYFKCLGNKNGVVNFTESKNPGLSGVTEIQKNQENYSPKKTGWRDPGFIRYDVEMTTLLNVLDENNSPHQIDYIGMDCEGSEYNILEHYFNNNTKYLVKFMCIEVGRNDIIELVKNNDYIELINPLPIPLWNGRIVTWEKYFIHKSEINNIDNKLIKDKSAF